MNQPQLREAPEEQRCTIERASKLGAKPYDGSGDPEATLLWLDRVSKIYRREFTNRFSSWRYKDARVEEFFSLEQKSMLVIDYEEKFSELVRFVPFIQEDEEQKCKRGDKITNVADRVPPRADSVRLVGRKVRQNGLVAKEHTGEQRSARDQLGLLQHPEEGHFIKECPQLVTTKGSEAGIDTAAPTPSTGDSRHTGRGFQTKEASIAAGRGAGGRGSRSRGGIPVGQLGRGSCT
ncbi:hypothetical protein ACOSQ2_032416 [Xanthoceras sorbifolium]